VCHCYVYDQVQQEPSAPTMSRCREDRLRKKKEVTYNTHCIYRIINNNTALL